MAEYDRWQAALDGKKLDMGERGDPPSGYFRRSVGKGRWEAIAVYREGDGIRCCRNIYGDGSKLSAGEIDELFAGIIYAVPYEIYVAADSGAEWPPEYLTSLTTAEIKAGVVWTVALGKAKVEAAQMGRAPKVDAPRPVSLVGIQQAVENERAIIGDNSKNAEPYELLRARYSDLTDDYRKWLKQIGGKVIAKDHADKAVDFAAAFFSLEKEATEAHRVAKQPSLDEGRAVDGTWKPIIAQMLAAKREATSITTPYLREQDDKARAAAAKAAEEAKGEAPLVQAVKPRVGNGSRGVALKDVSKPVIEDLGKVAAYLAAMETPPVDFYEVCKTAARKIMQAGVEVPGAKMVTTREAA